MTRHIWLLVTGCFWAWMMYLLFEREIKPYFEYQKPPTYRTMLEGRRKPLSVLRSIRRATDRVGHVETLIEPLPEGGHRMRTRLLMEMGSIVPLDLGDDRIYLSREVRVDERYRLARFDLTCFFTGLKITAQGEREGEKLRLKYNLLIFQDEKLVEYPEDAIFSDNLLPYLGGARLSEGKKWRIRMLDLGSAFSIKGKPELSFTEVYAKVTGREPIRRGGRDQQAFKVEVRKAPSDVVPAYELWVNDEGVVLQQRMTMNKMAYMIVLEDRRELEQAGEDYSWRVAPPEGRPR